MYIVIPYFRLVVEIARKYLLEYGTCRGLGCYSIVTSFQSLVLSVTLDINE